MRYVLLQSFRVPLHSAPLLLILLLAVMLTVAERGGVLGIPLGVIALSWFLKYGFALADHVTDGRPDAPVLSAEMVNPLEQRPLATCGLLAAGWFAADALGARLGPPATAVMRLALVAILPAMIAALSVGGRLVDALNPAAVFGIPRRIPGAYALLVLALAAVWLTVLRILRAAAYPVVAGLGWESILLGHAFFALGWRESFTLFGVQVLLLYAWLASFACIGATAYAHRAALGLEASVTPERQEAREAAELERQRHRHWDGVYAEARGGSLASAGETLRKLLAESPDPVVECRWLYGRAVALGNERLANCVAQLGTSRLLAVGETGAALELVRDRLRASADFRPLTAAEALRIAELARVGGDRSTARRLLADFARCYPGDPLTTRAACMQTELS
jgi:hypothetical protein